MASRDPLIERIERQAGVPGLLDVLAARLPPTDLQSLLLEAFRRRAAAVAPARLLDQYGRDRFVAPAGAAPAAMAELDLLAFSLLPDGFEAVELSPVCPLGTNSAIATVDQNKVVTTARNTEVVADATNVLALECAVRRRDLLRRDARSAERVKLASSHRVVRTPPVSGAGAYQHFRLLGLVTAGRDEGSYRFEIATLLEQLTFFLALLRDAGRLGLTVAGVRVGVTDLEKGRRTPALEAEVLGPLAERFPDARCALDPGRMSGRGYYASACFGIFAMTPSGEELNLVDGGFTEWTRTLVGSAKERLLIGGLGTERLLGAFAAR